MRTRLTALFLCFAILLGIAGTASGAINVNGQKTASGDFFEDPNIYTYKLGSLELEPCREDTIVGYDPATGVLFYVRQNPWSSFDPLGLETHDELISQRTELEQLRDTTVQGWRDNGMDVPQWVNTSTLPDVGALNPSDGHFVGGTDSQRKIMETYKSLIDGATTRINRIEKATKRYNNWMAVGEFFGVDYTIADARNGTTNGRIGLNYIDDTNPEHQKILGIPSVESFAFEAATTLAGVGAFKYMKRPKSVSMWHYTDDAGLDGILSSKKLNPSTKANNPNDARFGDGQYLSDIAPGTRTNSELSYDF